MRGISGESKFLGGALAQRGPMSIFGRNMRSYLSTGYSAGGIDKFMAKALEELKGAVVVCLVPCATEPVMANYAMKAQEIRYQRQK